MKLYEIMNEYRNIIDSIMDNDGEMDVELLDQLNAVQANFEEKAESYTIIIKELNAEAKAIKEEKLALAERQARAEKHAENLKRWLANALNEQGITTFKTPKCALCFRKSESVVIEDDALLPDEYLRVTVAPDKTAIKTALQNGITIEGCSLSTNQNLQIK